MFFFFNDTATTEIYTPSLHDALPICIAERARGSGVPMVDLLEDFRGHSGTVFNDYLHYSEAGNRWVAERDRKSTRLNSSHVRISYAVFCLKKNTRPQTHLQY